MQAYFCKNALVESDAIQVVSEKYVGTIS